MKELHSGPAGGHFGGETLLTKFSGLVIIGLPCFEIPIPLSENAKNVNLL